MSALSEESAACFNPFHFTIIDPKFPAHPEVSKICRSSPPKKTWKHSYFAYVVTVESHLYFCNDQQDDSKFGTYIFDRVDFGLSY